MDFWNCINYLGKDPLSFFLFFTGLEYQNDATSYDYNYDNQDYVEEPQPSLIPQFTIEAQHYKVAKDRVIRLPCRVDQLGKIENLKLIHAFFKACHPDVRNLMTKFYNQFEIRYLMISCYIIFMR